MCFGIFIVFVVVLQILGLSNFDKTIDHNLLSKELSKYEYCTKNNLPILEISQGCAYKECSDKDTLKYHLIKIEYDNSPFLTPFDKCFYDTDVKIDNIVKFSDDSIISLILSLLIFVGVVYYFSWNIFTIERKYQRGKSSHTKLDS